MSQSHKALLFRRKPERKMKFSHQMGMAKLALVFLLVLPALLLMVRWAGGIRALLGPLLQSTPPWNGRRRSDNSADNDGDTANMRIWQTNYARNVHRDTENCRPKIANIPLPSAWSCHATPRHASSRHVTAHHFQLSPRSSSSTLQKYKQLKYMYVYAGASIRLVYKIFNFKLHIFNVQIRFIRQSDG